MSKTKKIIAMLLVVALAITASPLSAVFTTKAEAATQTAAGKLTVAPPYAITATATPVTRVANAQYRHLAGTTIVKATPSGISESTGTYKLAGYAGEDVQATAVSLTIPAGCTLDKNPEINTVSGGSNVTFGSPSKSGNTYTFHMTGGTASEGSTLVFEISYTISGQPFKSYAYSYVKNVANPAGQDLFRRKNKNATGGGTTCRYEIFYRILSMQSYGGISNTGQAIGYADWSNNDIGSVGNNVNLSDQGVGQYVIEETTTSMRSIFCNGKDGGSDARYNAGYANDGNRSWHYQFVDSSKDTLESLNMRFCLVNCRTADIKKAYMPWVAVCPGNTEYLTSSSTGESAFLNNGVNAAAISTVAIPNEKGVSSLGGFAFENFTGAGFTTTAANTIPSNTYYGTLRYTYYYQMEAEGEDKAYAASSTEMHFTIYNKGFLRDLYNGIIAGAGNSQSFSMGNYNNGTASVTYNKGVNPQEFYYSGGWSEFKTALDAAGATLANFTTSQDAINTAFNNLLSKYNNLKLRQVTGSVEFVNSLTGATMDSITSETVYPGYVMTVTPAAFEGYTIDGNGTVTTKVLGSDSATNKVTYTYSPKAVALKFLPLNGGSVITVDSNYERAFTPTTTNVPAPEKANYTFVGWYASSEDAASLTNPVWTYSNGTYTYTGSGTYKVPLTAPSFYAGYELTGIKATFDTGVASSAVSIPAVNVVPGNSIAEPTYNGALLEVGKTYSSIYQFAGWYADSAYTTPVTWPVATAVGETDRTYYAKFNDVGHTIYFDSNGGTTVNAINKDVGTSVNAPEAPEKKGYTFAGWYYDNGTFENAASWPIEMPYVGFTLYAKWTPNNYTISFDLDFDATTRFDTEDMPELIGPADETVEVIPNNPRRFGYTFSHWELNGEEYTFSTYPTENITLVAVWDEDEASAFIELDAYVEAFGSLRDIDDSNGNGTPDVRTGDIVTVRMTSTTNFFTGSSMFVFMFDSDMYQLVGSGAEAFALNGSNDYISGIAATHTAVTNSAVLPWPSAISGLSSEYTAVQVAIDPTITPGNYNAEPMADGTWMIEFQLEVVGTTGDGRIYMDKAWVRDVDNPTGTMFYGWCAENTDSAFNSFNAKVTPDLIDADITIEIDETERVYTQVTLDANGGTFAGGAATVTYPGTNGDSGEVGKAITGWTPPTKTGYKLVNWLDADNNEWIEGYYPEATTTYVAQWAPEKFDAVFYLNQACSESQIVGTVPTEYNTAIVPVADPTLKGYIFAGWVNADTDADVDFVNAAPIMDADGESFYAKWTPGATTFNLRVNYKNVATGADTQRTFSFNAISEQKIYVVEAVPAEPEANAFYLTYADINGKSVANYHFEPAHANNELEDVVLPDGSTFVDVWFVPNTYTVNFLIVANGEVFHTFTGTYQDIIQGPTTDPVREGYTFTGNYAPGFTQGETKLQANRNYIAQWTINTYNVNFYNDADATEAYYTTTANYATKVNAPTGDNLPVKQGFVHTGWVDADNNPVTFPVTQGAADANYYATWSYESFDINYVVDNSPYFTDSVEYTSALEVIDDPVKDGYIFDGWYTDNTYATKYEFPATMPNNDITVYGRFTPATYDAKFYADQDGDGTAELYVTVPTLYGENIAAPADPSRPGYSFAGWTPSVGVMDTVGGEEYTAEWIAATQTYYVTFYYMNVDGNGYTEATAEKLTYTSRTDETVSYTAGTVTGFTLNTDESTLSGKIPATGNLTLAVYYDRDQYTYTIDIDGETTVADKYYGATITAPETPTKTGYTFDKWVNDADEAVNYSFTMPAEDVTVYATWKLNKHDALFYVDYNGDGTAETLFATVPTNYGEQIVAPAGPTDVTGYTFTEWTPAVGVMEDNDMTFTAVLTANNYDATFIVDGEEYAVVSTAFNSQIEAPADPSKTGYTFKNWSPEVGIMNDVNGMTFTAVFDPNPYTATFYAQAEDTEAYHSATVNFDAAINAPTTNPVRPGYFFQGWALQGTTDVLAFPQTMNSVDGKTFVGIWEADSNVTYYVTTYTMDTTGNYDSGNRVPYDGGVTDQEVSYTPTVPAGFKLGEGTVLSGTIVGGETLELYVYLAREQYTFTVIVDEDTTATDYFFGATVTAPETPSKTGYTFAGWGASVPATMPANDVTLTAQWNVNSYTITFNTNGGSSIPAITQAYGTDVTAPADPTRTGYTFAGWDKEIPATIPAENVTITASWTANTYDAVFYSDDEIYETVPTEFDKAIEAPADPVKEGYTFKGWNPEVGVMDTVNGERYDAVWEINSYYAIFVSEGTEVSKIKYTYGDIIAAAVDQSKEGYTFKGWAYEGSTDIVDFTAAAPAMGAGDATFVAVFEVNTYNAIFNPNNGNFNGSTDNITVPTEFGQAIKAPADPSRDGYTFNGWAPAVPETMPAGDRTFRAQWKINQYTITFANTGDTTIAPITQDFGTSVAAPADPTRTGYTFAGWDVEVPATMPAENITITASWTINQYTITFINTGDTVIAPITQDYGTDVTAPADPTKTGYIFAGWDKEIPATMPAENMTITASWTADSRDYYVTFYYQNVDGNGYTQATDETLTQSALTGAQVAYSPAPVEGFGLNIFDSVVTGTVPADGTLTLAVYYTRNQYQLTIVADGTNVVDAKTYYGAAIETPEDPTKAGYTFAGWDKEIPATMPADDLTITALWTVNQYTITFANTGDTTIAPITQDFGTAVKAPADPTKAGYTFAGWDVAVPATMPAEDMTITASWTVNQYTITFANTGDTTIAPITQDYGTAVTAPADPTKTGYTFAGWDAEVPATMPAEDMTITASWTINQYTITFANTGDATIAPITQDYGTAVTAPADPTWKGYTFAGWDVGVPATMPAEDMTITATWTTNEYAITFNTDGGSYVAPITQDFGTAVTAPADPTKTGYTFAGWDAEIPATMPAEDMTITAQWTINQYTITFANTGDTAITPITQDYATDVTAPADPTRTGYTFAGWDKEIPATMPAEDMTITADWTINTYTVTYLDKEGNVHKEFTNVEFAAAIPVPDEDPSYEYYTFIGWDNALTAMPANDLTINAIFERVPVTLEIASGSTAVIERFDDATEENTGLIYGLKRRITENVFLNTYVQVIGDGHLVCTPNEIGFGTGTKVELVDNVTGLVVETYHVVIFGDLNGDAEISAADQVVMLEELAFNTTWSYETLGEEANADYEAYRLKAADLNGDGNISAEDNQILTALIQRSATVSQTDGTVTNNS